MAPDALLLPPFSVTPAAISEISALGRSLLLDIEEGGCCGTAYVFSLLDAGQPLPTGIRRYGCEGAWLLISDRAKAVLEGATLDYRASTRPPRFTVRHNPNTPGTCPCRRSFGAAWPGSGQSECRSYLPMPWDQDYEPPARWQRQTGRRRENGWQLPRTSTEPSR